MNLPDEILALIEEEGVIRIAMSGGKRYGMSIAQEAILKMVTDRNAKVISIALPTDAIARKTFDEMKQIADSLKPSPSMDFEEFTKNPSKLRKLAELHKKEKLSFK